MQSRLDVSPSLQPAEPWALINMDTFRELPAQHMYTLRGQQQWNWSGNERVPENRQYKGTTQRFTKGFLRVVDPFEKLLDSSRCSDLGLFLRDLFRGRGFTRPCSSISASCFLRRYSCLISSRRAFSSSLRIRSSSALRLERGGVWRENKIDSDKDVHTLHTYTLDILSGSASSWENKPALITFELTLDFLLLFT